MNDVFERLLAFEEKWNRMAPRYGLVCAQVRSIGEDGIELDYLSTALDAPSSPARVATLMAGNGRGAFFVPEVGDEVIVGFELGDIDRPVILGAMWNDVDAPPSQADTSASNNVRTIVSRAGHEITFDDSPAGGITIRTDGGMEIVIEDSRISIKTTGNVASSRIVLDGVSWNHQHATGTGPSGPPVSVIPGV